jgi:prepilin-type N-terminal cleavage/methylation domain-containing protein
MVRTSRSTGGYSLVELLAALAIVSVLALAAAAMLRPRATDAVRSVMAEVEGLLVNAQNAANLTPMDIYVAASGNWTEGTLVIDGRPLVTTGAHAVASPPSLAQQAPGSAVYRVGPDAECFRSRYAQGSRDHLSAAIDTTGAWYAAALGGAPGLAQVSPVDTSPDFTAALATPLCTGSQNSVVMNRISHQFVTGFSIVVVGLAGGAPIPNGPVGVIVVPAGGANLFKYFKPAGQDTWGRL